MGNSAATQQKVPANEQVKQDEIIDESQEDRTLVQIYDKLVNDKHNYLSAGDVDRISFLKVQLLQFLENNQAKIQKSINENRCLLYRFINDYSDCFFCSLSKKPDIGLWDRLKRQKTLFFPDSSPQDIQPFIDIDYQLNVLMNFENFKLSEQVKTRQENLQKLQNKIQRIFKYQQKDEEDSIDQLKSIIHQDQQWLKEFHQEFKQDQIGDDVYYYLDVKLDNIYHIKNSEQYLISSISCLKSLQPSLIQQEKILQVLSQIIFFLESEILKQVDQITINAADEIVLFFVKNLIQMATNQQEGDQQKEDPPLIKYMIYLITLHLSAIFEKKGDVDNPLYEEICLFMVYYEKLIEFNTILSLKFFKKEKQIQMGNYERLINLKYGAKKFNDLSDYYQEIKNLNKFTTLNLPEFKEMNSYSQCLIYLSGDQIGDSAHTKDQKAVYQLVINYFLKESSSNTKTLFIEGQIDSGKTIFIKKLMKQIEEYNQKNPKQVITPIYLRAKYLKLQNSDFNETLLSQPLNLTLSQKKLLLENNIKIFIIDGINDTYIQRQKIIKLIQSIEGKNINFLITAREESLESDFFIKLQNYSIQQLQTVHFEKNKQSDYDIFKPEEISNLSKIQNQSQIYKLYSIVNQVVNIQMMKELRIIFLSRNSSSKTSGMEELLSQIQNQYQLIKQYINIRLEGALIKANNPQTSLNQKIEYPKQIIKLCKEYLECLAFASYINEQTREDEDFSAQDSDVQKYLSPDANQQIKSIKTILQCTNLTFEYCESIGLYTNNQPYNYFKLTTVFQHFLVKSFLRDFKRQKEDIKTDVEENLVKFKINQRPIINQKENKFQIDLLNMLCHKLINLKQNNSQEIDQQNKSSENQVNDTEEIKQSGQEDNNLKKQLKSENINERLSEMNVFILDYVKRSNSHDSIFKIGASNIISALFQSNMKMNNYNFENIYIPYAYFNQSIQKQVIFSNQLKNNIILKNSPYLTIPGCTNILTKNTQFNLVNDFGGNFYPKQPLSFNDKFLFLISSNFLFKYEFDDKEFVLRFMGDFDQKKPITHLKRCKTYLYISTSSNIYRIQPKSLKFNILEFEDKEINFSVFAVSDCGKFITTHSNNSYKFIIWSVSEQSSILKVYHKFPQIQGSMYFMKYMKDNPYIIALSYESSRMQVLNISENQKKEDSESLDFDLDTTAGSVNSTIDFYGKLMAVGNHDCRVRLYEFNQTEDTKYKLINTIQHHSDYIRQVSFSSCGNYILIAADDYCASIYDVEKKEKYFLKGKHNSYVMNATFIKDNKMVATTCHEGTVVNIWDVSQITTQPIQKAGDELNKESEQNKPKIKELFLHQISNNTFSSNCIQFSNNNKQLAQATPDGKIIIWKVIKDKQNNQYQLLIHNQIYGHLYPVTCVSYSPDNKLLASCSNDRKILLWNVEENYTQVNQNIMEHDDAVNCVAFSLNFLNSQNSQNYQDLASGGWDDCIKIWRIQKSSQNIYSLKLINTLEHEDAVLSLAYSPLGDILASGSADKTIKIWKIQENYKQIQVLPEQNWVYQLHFIYNGKSLIAGFKDDTIKVYDVQSFKPTYQSQNHSGSVSSVSSINSGRTFLSGSYDKSVICHKLDKKGQYQKIKIVTHQYPVNSIATSKNEKLFISSSKNSIKLFKINPLIEFQQLRHDSSIKVCCFASNGILATLESNGILKMWDSNNRFQLIANIDTQHTIVQGSYNIVFPYNCEYFATSSPHECKIWSKHYKLVNTINFTERYSTVQFSSHANFLVIYNQNSGIKLYKKNQKELFQDYIDIPLPSGQKYIPKQQILTLLSKYTIPLINYCAYETFYQFQNDLIDIQLKSVIFSQDENYMFINYNYYTYCYKFIDEKFQIFEEVEDKAITNFNDYFYVKSYSHLNNLNEQEKQNYSKQLLQTPLNLYQEINLISSSYKSTTTVSFNYKYYCIVSESTQVWVYKNYNYIIEQLRDKEIECDDEEDVEVEVQVPEEVDVDEEVEIEEVKEVDVEVEVDVQVEVDEEIKIEEQLIDQNQEKNKSQQILEEEQLQKQQEEQQHQQQQPEQQQHKEQEHQQEQHQDQQQNQDQVQDQDKNQELEQPKEEHQENILNNKNDNQENNQTNQENQNNQNEEQQDQQNDQNQKQDIQEQSNQKEEIKNDELDKNKENEQTEQTLIENKKIKKFVTQKQKQMQKQIQKNMIKVMQKKKEIQYKTVKKIEKRKKKIKIQYKDFKPNGIYSNTYPDYYF